MAHLTSWVFVLPEAGLGVSLPCEDPGARAAPASVGVRGHTETPILAA